MIKDIIAAGWHLSEDYWTGFTKGTQTDLDRIERELQISLPDDFKQFYLEVGWGKCDEPNVPDGGIYSPDDIISECHSPIPFITGSRWPRGEEWATVEEHRQLWITNGTQNPNPERFTNEILNLEGVLLWDLLQVGSDGSCGTFNIYVGSGSPPYRCCVIHEASLLESSNSFLECYLAHLHDEAEAKAEVEAEGFSSSPRKPRPTKNARGRKP